MTYLVEFEKGLRNYSSSVHSLGTRPLRSRSYWGNKVQLWRKREAYIALARHLLCASPEYMQWDCFKFEDYVMRQVLAKTFCVRHLPLSNGKDEENFNGELKFNWVKHEYKAPKRVSRPTHVKKEIKLPKDSSSAAPKSQQPMIFDVELGELVPMSNS